MAQGPSRRGTGYTNLQTYLGLNQGAAQQMGARLAGDVERQGQAFDMGLTGAMNDFKRQVQSGTVQGPTGTYTSEQAGQNAGRQYTGPSGLGDTANMSALTGQAAEVQNQAGALGNNTGRATLLGKAYGQNTWGGGQLDAALAGAGGASGRLGAAQGAYGRLVERLGGASNTATGMANAARDSSTANARAWGNAATGARQQEQAAAQQATQQRRTEREETQRNVVARRNNRSGDSINDNYYP